jgi:TetR/AcrR family transcriptional regulator
MAASEKTARRNAILTAATDLFARWSLTDISMDRVAARAGIAKGTVYLYFRTKESLFLSLFEELHNKWHIDLRERLVSADQPVEARDAASGLLDHQNPCHHVPGLERLLPEAV